MLVMAMMLMVVVVVLMTIRMISACALRRAAYLDAEEVVEERADEVVVQESLGLRRRDQEGQDAQLLRARLAWLWTPDTHAQCQRPANTTHNTSCLNATSDQRQRHQDAAGTAAVKHHDGADLQTRRGREG